MIVKSIDIICGWIYIQVIRRFEEYAMIEYDFLNNMSHSLNFFGASFVTFEYWLTMLDNSFFIANKKWIYNGLGPQDIINHTTIVITQVNSCHYMNVDLLSQCYDD